MIVRRRSRARAAASSSERSSTIVAVIYGARAYEMVSNLDIWRAANLLIRECGADAEVEAARLQDLMLDRDDDEGRLVWARIRQAIEALRAPPCGKPN